MSKRRSSLSQISTLHDLESFRSESKKSIELTKCFRCSKRIPTPTASRRRRSSSSVVFSELITSSEPLPFTMKLSACSQTYQKQIMLPFTASFMKEISDSPYFAEINLNDYYIAKEKERSSRGSKRKFPGFQIPVKGKLQLIIYNNEKSVSSLLFFPYDLSNLKENHKKIIKFRKNSTITYDSESDKDFKINIKKLHNELEFKALNYKNKRFYVFDSLKITFVPGFLSENVKLPLSANLPEFRHHQFNPKIPLYPQSSQTDIETVESGEYPVNLSYYIRECAHCNDHEDDDDECIQFPTFTYA
ncbi:hypothetical protein KL939_004061 [Ogataea angusta]|nr:hypothetical protein KL939_004061 [Ogataea angusta]